MSATRPLVLTSLRSAASAKPETTALVPFAGSAQWIPPSSRAPSPDPTFVTQLIANAEQLADRRRWPRDRAKDASAAYHAHRPFGAGMKTRQTI